MRASRLLLLGLTAYAVLLVATLPASVVAPAVARASGGQARLVAASGTAWHGRGRLEVSVPGLAFALDSLSWRLRPASLLAGRLAFSVEASAGGLEARGVVSRSPAMWRLGEATVSGEAAAAARFAPLAAAWQPGGTLAARSEELAWDGRAATGEASVEWREASLALSPVRPLGTWRASLTGETGGLAVAVQTVKGPLRVAGRGRLALPAGRLAFAGEARAEPAEAAALEPLLALLGPRRADGARTLEAR